MMEKSSAIKRAFGKKLQSLRDERHLTQTQVDELLNVSIGTFGAWERGERSPAIADLLELAKLFEVSIDSLFEYSSNRLFTSLLGITWRFAEPPSDRQNTALKVWNQLADGTSLSSLEPSPGEALAEFWLKEIIHADLIDVIDLPYADELQDQIRKKFGLRRVRVVKAGRTPQREAEQSPAEMLFRKFLVAEAARVHYKENISQREGNTAILKIGISGGSTISYFVYSLQRGECKNVEFYPLASTPEVNTTAIDANSLVGALAFRHDGYNVTGHTLHYTQQNEMEAANSQSAQASMTRRILTKGAGVDVVFMGMGPIDKKRERQDMLENVLLNEGLSVGMMKTAGAVGDILFHIVNRDGELVYPQINSLICSLAPSALQELVRDNIPVIILAAGEKKKEIVWVAIKHKYANELIIDDQLASALLKMGHESSNRQ